MKLLGRCIQMAPPAAVGEKFGWEAAPELEVGGSSETKKEHRQITQKKMVEEGLLATWRRKRSTEQLWRVLWIVLGKTPCGQVIPSVLAITSCQSRQQLGDESWRKDGFGFANFSDVCFKCWSTCNMLIKCCILMCLYVFFLCVFASCFFSIDPTRQQTSTKTAGTGPWTLSPFAVSTGRNGPRCWGSTLETSGWSRPKVWF